MTRISDSFGFRDTLCVFWIESGSCRNASFEVDGFGSELTGYDFKLSSGDREAHLYKNPTKLHVLGEEIGHDTRQAYPALAFSEHVSVLTWDYILSMLTQNYSAEDAIDLFALGFSQVSPEAYSQVRGVPPSDLQDRVDCLIDMLEDPVVVVD